MTILVLGAGGMAGHVISLYLRENGFDVTTLSATHALDKKTSLIDVTDQEKFKSFLKSRTFDVVINCIALLVKPSEVHKDLAIYLNSYLPRYLENFFKDSRTRIVHISTDGVFSGLNPPYKEDSKYDGETFYGRTKSLGEIINSKDLTFRMSIIGPTMRADGTGLLNWFLSQAGEIKGFTNVYWNGVTTLELAKGIKAALNQNLAGLYHFVPNQAISKYEKLQLFKELFEIKNIHIKPARGKAVGTTLVASRTDFAYKIPDYKTMFQDIKVWIDTHQTIYKHYAR